MGSEPRVTRFKINWDDTPQTNGSEIVMEETSTSTMDMMKSNGHDRSSLAGSTQNGIGDEQQASTSITLLNENSNSLAQMECA